MDTSQDLTLVAVDFSDASRLALAHAMRKIRPEEEASLLLLHVVELPELGEIARLTKTKEEDLKDRITRTRLAQIDALIGEVGGDVNDRAIETLVLWGTPFREILRTADDFAVDEIVLGTSGRTAEFEKMLFGGTAERVLRGAGCRVVCVPLVSRVVSRAEAS